jgi:hypothetical protein
LLARNKTLHPAVFRAEGPVWIPAYSGSHGEPLVQPHPVLGVEAPKHAFRLDVNPVGLIRRRGSSQKEIAQCVAAEGAAKGRVKVLPIVGDQGGSNSLDFGAE